MLLQSCALGVTMSWDDGFPGARASRPHDDGFLGARASRPHQAWHSLGCLPHLDQPGTAPWLSYGLADAVPAHRMAACSIALKLSGGQRDRMRAGRPRSQARPAPALPCGSFEEKRPIVHEDEPRMNTKFVEIFSPFPTFGGSLLSLLQPLRGPSRTPFESFPTPWSPFADPLARPLADPS